MKKNNIILLLVLMSSFYTSSTILAKEHDHDNHHKAQQNAMQLNHGEKWHIDASLHSGMTRIKASMEKNISPIHNKEFTAKQYVVLAAEISSHLTFLFKNCKLPAAADEQLHTLLFKVMKGTKQMEAADEQRSGAIKIIKALQTYPEYFNDKDWRALSH